MVAEDSLEEGKEWEGGRVGRYLGNYKTAIISHLNLEYSYGIIQELNPNREKFTPSPGSPRRGFTPSSVPDRNPVTLGAPDHGAHIGPPVSLCVPAKSTHIGSPGYAPFSCHIFQDLSIHH